MFPFRVQSAKDRDAPGCAAMERFPMKIHRFILRFMLANFATAARFPSGYEFIRRPRLLGHPCPAGFAGVWFRQEKPLRFRAGPAGAAQAFMDCGDMSPLSKRRHVGAVQRRIRHPGRTSAVRRGIFVEPQIENPHPACGYPFPSDGRGTSSVGAVYSNHSPMMPPLRSLGFSDFNFLQICQP
jgi:hypothetical protein